MKNFLSFVVATLFAASMMAKDYNLSPIADYSLRTNNADPTAWNSGFPKTDLTAVEANYNSRMWGQQLYDVTGIDFVNATSVTLTLNIKSGTAAIALWPYPNANWTDADSLKWKDGKCPVVETFKSVVGAYPGAATADYTYMLSSDITLNKAVFTFDDASKLALLRKGLASKDGRQYLSLIITSAETKTPANAKVEYYTTKFSDEEKPVLAVTAPAAKILNNCTFKNYDDFATAVNEATTGDGITLFQDVTISGSRLEIKKELTIQGATGAEKIICGVPANTLMVLANDNTANYTVAFKNLIVDGQNTERSTQLFDANNKAQLSFENVSVINTTYSVVTGDVKNSGNAVILKGNNSFPTGIYLNKNKRVNAKEATHTTPIRLVLAGDYVDGYVVVQNCADPDLFTVVDAEAKYDIALEKNGDSNELKCKKTEKDPTAISNTAAEHKAVKRIVNGKFVIEKNGKLFDLTGAQL